MKNNFGDALTINNLSGRVKQTPKLGIRQISNFYVNTSEPLARIYCVICKNEKHDTNDCK